MVCRLIEGFEHSTQSADYVGKWSAETVGAVSTTYGRYGNGVQLSGTTTRLTKTLDNQATWIVGAAVRLGNPPATTAPLLEVLDGGTIQAGLGVTAAGALFVYRATPATVLGTSAATGLLLPGVWAYVEWRVTVGNTAPVLARVNAVEVLNLPSVDTSNTANAFANAVRLAAPGSGNEVAVDDVYVFDATGSANTAFVGDVRVAYLAPNGAGATTAWTPSAGANYACVDETATPNDDTDYVASATAGQTDTYAFANLTTASGTVHAVQAMAHARKDDAGTRTFAFVARPGGTDRLGAALSLGDTYTSWAQVWDVNPDTSAAWTLAAVNAAEFGQRLLS
jgi:hypothetical protein